MTVPEERPDTAGPAPHPPRLYEFVVDRILEIVKSRGLRPGQALPAERDLAVELQISRNVLRQAFGILEERGLIRTRRGSGRYLRAVDVDGLRNHAPRTSLEVASIADILEVRILLEEHVAALACQRRTIEEARQLLSLAERLASWDDNLAFHAAVAAATHNFMLERLVRQQAELLGQLRQRDHYEDQSELTRMRAEHHAIAVAVAERDEVRARSLIRKHLEDTRRAVFSSVTPAGPHGEGANEL